MGVSADRPAAQLRRNSAYETMKSGIFTISVSPSSSSSGGLFNSFYERALRFEKQAKAMNSSRN